MEHQPMKVKVGEFSIENGIVTGPGDYMKEQGCKRLHKIEKGQDSVVNFAIRSGHQVDRAVLVSLQTDYAAWLGAQQLRARV